MMKIDILPMPPALPEALRKPLEQLSFPTIGHFLEEGFMEPAIRAMVTPSKIVGRAVTVRVTVPDAVLIHKATELLEPGDALVIDSGGDNRHALVGETIALAARSRGAVAILVDGICTDIVELQDMGFPVFARGTSILTAKLHGLQPGAINAQVVCGSVVVNPGDVILADDNGAVCLPPETARQVLDPAMESEAREPEIHEHLRQGGSLSERSGANRILEDVLGS
jgi:regulator of RNase E activity RraA